SMNNLAVALRTRFEQGGDRKDLEKAIQLHRNALALTPPGHPSRAGSLDNIATALKTRFKQGGNEKDLDEALERCQMAEAASPPSHPD
ncbi:hypothetical protein BS17DRAFT_663966, partial [Gyrodon lividus]